ncbi:bifunctional diaminohydroxyphosphoribosylaminopyrimidine deaminase/5-amino-6-(5-phosphoribosylamino)uracil reductase RibD [Halorhodospira halophila]|uniref:Riboflavin biosynthesis protein RibD n=1 Tax=Halorhodospira halophila (strain DSM 244 / SL1) TaxID=349124 RepID=A1WVG4_HALHL|nr:5-amino-6-(5-phosphoribosylamino)uracil reductase / diaminohydroxyphosphoribosylaminopyrimidine deaminase [Halorhodospira halophila SL1]MBK1728991.1 riboflavin biosynthesis protein RibD [Halorhodospira halophila]
MTTTDRHPDDPRWMARAIRRAAAVCPPPHPNPRVGCVLVRDGSVLAEAAHEQAGGPHAEAAALQAAGGAAHGATAYVTLEPCAHYGRTPPCARALIDAGVSRVVVGHRDPNPRVAGGGIAQLEAAGVAVTEGVLAADAEALNRGFLRRMAGGRPWVRVKLAASLDGRTAMASGESHWITSAAARRDVHRGRAEAAAVLTGVGTVRADDPRLDARDVEPAVPAERQPQRVVLDPRLTTPPHAALFQAPGPVLIGHAEYVNEARARALRSCGAELLPLPLQEGGLDLAAVLDALAAREINEVWVEAGPTLAGSWVRGGWADELIVYTAPHLMGDAARPLLALPGIETMAQRQPLAFSDVRRVGEEIRITARLV